MKIDEILQSTNIAEDLNEQLLIKIGDEAYQGYEIDLGSRKHFEEMINHWTKIALQVADKKTYPWNNAANVKYPLLATASMQFAARAYPSLVPPNGQVVKCRVLGSDRDGQKQQRASRVSKFMSYQLMDEMEEWEEDFDRLLLTLPIVGTVFKKTYWDGQKQRNCSRAVLPKSLVVNYWAKSLEDAERITEIIPMSKRKIIEKQLGGLYLEIPLGDPQNTIVDEVEIHGQQTTEADNTTPFTILEQHCYLDLDDDGYSEPYVVTFEESSHKVLRIVARFFPEDVKRNDRDKVLTIEPLHFYTKFGFVPNPDGGFYDIGFGRLLGPLNDAVDTITNQLIDAGSLSNLQAGFIGKGLRVKVGDTKFSPGEWKVVNATADDIKKQIFPLPVRDPSPVLMELLKFLITAGKELASVAEIFVGKMPGQNTPATTTMASIDQGMKVFTAVYKRIYRSLGKEFRKLYKLNKMYLDPQTEIEFLGEQIPQSDFFGPEHAIIPGADPAAVSAQEKQAKVQALMQILQLGTIDPMFVTQMYLEAYEIPQAEKAIRQTPQDPSPEQQQMQAEIQMKTQESQMKMKEAEMTAQRKAAEGDDKIRINNALAQQKIQSEAITAVLERQALIEKHQAEMQMTQQKHAEAMRQAEDKHKQMLKQQPKKETK
jgi:chaperonin GroES